MTAPACICPPGRTLALCPSCGDARDTNVAPKPRCECGNTVETCRMPENPTSEERRAFWALHPIREGLRPLRSEAARRKGARL